MSLTINQLCETAAQLGYNIRIHPTYLHVSKQGFPHVYKNASLDDFSLDPEYAADYGVLVAYYWIRGYHLKYGDDGQIALHRAMHHPNFDQKVWVEGIFNYFNANWDLSQLHTILLEWVNTTEESEEFQGESDE